MKIYQIETFSVSQAKVKKDTAVLGTGNENDSYNNNNNNNNNNDDDDDDDDDDNSGKAVKRF